jgi:hypothetical protein
MDVPAGDSLPSGTVLQGLGEEAVVDAMTWILIGTADGRQGWVIKQSLDRYEHQTGGSP